MRVTETKPTNQMRASNTRSIVYTTRDPLRTPPTLSSTMRRTTASFLLAALVCSPVLCAERKKLQETLSFDIKPSGQITHQKIKLENGVTCLFTYAAVGGTNEEWSIFLKRTGKTEYTCRVERPEQASYLFFMSFAISILEHQVENVEVFDNSGALLQDEDYEITKDGRSVRHKEGGFQSNLSRLSLTAKKPAPSEL